jgi:hypothetical protein
VNACQDERGEEIGEMVTADIEIAVQLHRGEIQATADDGEPDKFSVDVGRGGRPKQLAPLLGHDVCQKHNKLLPPLTASAGGLRFDQ